MDVVQAVDGAGWPWDEGDQKRKGGRLAGDRMLADLCVLCDRFGGWITAELAGLWLWPASKSRVKSAERLIRRAVARQMLSSYPVTKRSNVYLLTAEGVSHIDRTGSGNHTERPCEWLAAIVREKKKGRTWKVPQSFEHNCRALRYLGWAQHRYGVGAVTEHEIARLNPDLKKRPDGVLIDNCGCTWVEVEGARKSGEEMTRMAETAVRIFWNHSPKIRLDVSGKYGFRSIEFVIPRKADDTRKVALNHPTRIKNRLSTYELPWPQEGSLVTTGYSLMFERDDGFEAQSVTLDHSEVGRTDRVFGIEYPEPGDYF